MLRSVDTVLIRIDALKAAVSCLIPSSVIDGSLVIFDGLLAIAKGGKARRKQTAKGDGISSSMAAPVAPFSYAKS